MHNFDLIYEQAITKKLRNLAATGLIGASTALANPPQIPSKTPQEISFNQNSRRIFDRYVQELKQFEGSKSYQKLKGYYRNGRFYPYKDSNGHMTVGYGHKILKGENFSKGLSEKEAELLLEKDARKAWNQTIELMREYRVNPDAEDREEIMVVLSGMVFQMGKNGVRKFERMWAAFRVKDYVKASEEMLDSKWARSDSPNRARNLAKRIRNL